MRRTIGASAENPWGSGLTQPVPKNTRPVSAVRVIVASRKLQAGDQAIFRHLGLEPAAQRILALKSSVHFRADFEPLASEVLVVEAPGPNAADPAKLPYRNLREGVRRTPGA